MNPTRIGIIGCGKIFDAYAKGALAQPQNLIIAAIADIRPEAAAVKAKDYNLKALSVDELLADPSISIVVNLTVPQVHVEVGLKILSAGKHLYAEKPLALSSADGKRLLDAAKAKSLRVGSAPDTVLGAGIQTAREAIDRGLIGRPLSGTAFMQGPGPESWHPNPYFYYLAGGGPMFDMGPYYMTALVTLLGPVKSVMAEVGAGFTQRIAGHELHKGKPIPVEVPTHYSGTLRFVNGALITVIMSFDVQGSRAPLIEIHGSEGSLSVPDPNGFGGVISVRQAKAPKGITWQDLPHTHAENARMFGVTDLAAAIHENRPHRCNGDIALHVLEIFEAFELSSKKGVRAELTTTCERPAAVPKNLAPWTI